MSTEIQAYTDAELAYRAVVIKAIIDAFTAEFKAIKELAAEQYENGDRKTVVRDRVKLGMLYRTDMDSVAVITDREAFEAYMTTSQADLLERRICLGAPEEVAAALQDAGHEPGDLWWIEEFIPTSVMDEKLADAKTGKRVPGMTVSTPAGYMTAKPSRAVRELVGEYLSASPVTLQAIDGGRP
ncbi:hypothetical protein [Rhodococcus jostii]|uniref:hypothetical protein n=1 Tax=Rhodococcus jostii TaxID=132919 RepID=UPI00362A282D